MFRFNKHVFWSAVAVVLLAAVVLFRFFGDVLQNPNEFLFGPSGDGLKNYYAVAYQIIHGDGTWFQGMLYPYGDHLIFADGQTLLTKVLQHFIEPDVNNGSQIIGIMNLLMLCSLVITAWCVHRLLVWSYVNPWFAVPFSLTIAFLSPQVARFTGHYALGYTFFIPMSWLLIDGFSRTSKTWLWVVLTVLLVTTFGFLHPYYLFLFALFMATVLAWELLIAKFRFGQVQHLLARSLSMIIPLVVLMAYQKWVDPYTDRPTAPAGIFSHMATFQSVFTPVANPFRNLFHSYFFRIFIPSSWEGHAYIGMVATIVLFASVPVGIRSFVKRKWKVFSHPVLPPTLKTTFFPGIITLLFAMGVFHSLGLYWLSEFIGPLKQFRSLGRVAWIFYYIISVWAVFHLYATWRHFRGGHRGKYVYHFTVIVALCAFAWMLDAIVNIKYSKSQMTDRNGMEVFSDKTAQIWKNGGVDIENHQTILPLPMMLIGSEKIGLEMGAEALRQSMQASFSTGLPIIGGTMSRTSMEVTEKSAQMVADSLFPRGLLSDLPNNRNLLILHAKEPLKAEEQRLISLGTKVFESESYELYSISIDAIQSTYNRIQSAENYMTNSSNGQYLNISGVTLSEETLWGAPVYEVEAMDQLLDSVFTTSDTLTISYWVKVDPETELLPNRVYTISREWKLGGGIGSFPNLLDGWLFVYENLITEAGKTHRYTAHARGGIVSRVQLRKHDSAIIHQEDEIIFVNNIPLRK